MAVIRFRPEIPQEEGADFESSLDEIPFVVAYNLSEGVLSSEVIAAIGLALHASVPRADNSEEHSPWRIQARINSVSRRL